MVAGFVYILSNETMPEVVKIGKTRRLPTDRSAELYTTGVALPFVVEFAIYVDDMDLFEQCVHEELSDCRVSKSREFFRISVQDAVRIVSHAYLSSIDLAVEHCDSTIDPGNFAWYCHVAGLCKPDLIQALDFIPDEVWRDAARKLDEKRKKGKLLVHPEFLDDSILSLEES